MVDDGVGGANPSAGSGLRGLADRVEALGGRLDDRLARRAPAPPCGRTSPYEISGEPPGLTRAGPFNF